MVDEDLQLSTLQPEADERISDAVTRILRRGIMRHEIRSGTHLSVPLIARKLNVSRSPVYDAIGRLVQEGLVRNYKNRGAFVRSYDMSSMSSCYEVRGVLEGLAACLAAKNSDSAVLDQLSSLLKAQKKAIDNDDIEQHISIDIDFHKCIMLASKNPVLVDALGRIYDRIRPAMVYRVVPVGPRLALGDHMAIFESIRRREARLAEDSARGHIMRLYQEMVSQGRSQ